MWLVLGAEGGREVDRGDAEEAGGYVATVGNYVLSMRGLNN